MRKLLILGATGSIGTTCLNEIKRANPGIQVVAITCYSNEEKARRISNEFGSIPFLCLKGRSKEEISRFIHSVDADIALNAIAGSDGLFATLECLECGMDVALANKESVVMGGSFLFDLAKSLNRRIIPVDSEHSAIYHLLEGHEASSLVITASGGPFIDRADLEDVTLEEALKHPTWKMGQKITIDSATLANKGLEVIEAHYLFGFEKNDIEVTIHRQSVIHSMIRTKEGGVYAQMSPPDMTLPIMSAISDNKLSLNAVVSPLSFSNLTLTFEKPDLEKFTMLSLAFKVLEKKGSYPIAYNAANEVAVQAFIDGRIRFKDISWVTSSVLQNDFSAKSMDYQAVMENDKKARELAKEAICKLP